MKRVPVTRQGVRIPVIEYGQRLLLAKAEAERLRTEILRLWNLIDCACNALTDSINVSGNDADTNSSWVRKLRKEAGEKP